MAPKHKENNSCDVGGIKNGNWRFDIALLFLFLFLINYTIKYEKSTYISENSLNYMYFFLASCLTYWF